jgi:hypothetical protein
MMTMTIRAALAMFCAAMLLFAAEAARAAEPEAGAAPPSEAKPDTAKPDTAKPDTAKPEAAKPETPEEKGGASGEASGAGESGGAARLKDLVGDGFVIRTTVFIPAEAVTRQLGKVSPDAVVLTLQKSTSTALCYYTFKAYVAEGLGAIRSCVVHG